MASFEPEAQYLDGLSLYQFVGGNPVNHTDPAGLFSYFDEADDLTAELYGTRLAGLAELRETLRRGFDAASMLGSFAVSMLPGGDALMLLGGIISGESVSFGDFAFAAISFVPGGGALNKAAKAAQAAQTAKAARTLDKLAGQYNKGRAAYKVSKGVVKLTGQLHHAISAKIHKALERHKKLKGKYKYRDPRFTTRAIDSDAHRGYQTWHRNLDDELADWISHPDQKYLTPAQFEAKLREIYNRPALLERFPMGLP